MGTNDGMWQNTNIEDLLYTVERISQQALTPHWPCTDASASPAAAFLNGRLLAGELEDYLQECLADKAEPEEMIQELLAALSCKLSECELLKRRVRTLSAENDFLQMDLAESVEGRDKDTESGKS